MCKFNGKEIRTREKESGNVFYKLGDVLKTLGYMRNTLPNARQIANLSPENVIAEPACKPGAFSLWMNRDGLNDLAARAAQAPTRVNRSAEWGKFLRFLDFGVDEAPEKAEPASSLFPKIDGLIEEYQKFKKEYESMQQELQRLQHENRKLKQLRIDVEKVLASGF